MPPSGGALADRSPAPDRERTTGPSRRRGRPAADLSGHGLAAILQRDQPAPVRQGSRRPMGSGVHNARFACDRCDLRSGSGLGDFAGAPGRIAQGRRTRRRRRSVQPTPAKRIGGLGSGPGAGAADRRRIAGQELSGPARHRPGLSARASAVVARPSVDVPVSSTRSPGRLF